MKVGFASNDWSQSMMTSEGIPVMGDQAGSESASTYNTFKPLRFSACWHGIPIREYSGSMSG